MKGISDSFAENRWNFGNQKLIPESKNCGMGQSEMRPAVPDLHEFIDDPKVTLIQFIEYPERLVFDQFQFGIQVLEL